jgi:hypothetical protein
MQQLALINPLKKPLTPAEWLRQSMAWTLATAAGWLLVSTGLSELFDANEGWVEALLFGTAAAAHLLIWYKAVLTTWHTVAEQTEPFWLSILSAGWTLLLVLFQLACLAFLFVYLLLILDSGNSGGLSF